MNSLGRAGLTQILKYEAHGPTHELSSLDQLLDRAMVSPLDMTRIDPSLFFSLTLLN